MNRPIVFAIPGDPDRKSGGTRYDRRMIEELCALGLTVEALRLPDGYPRPTLREEEEAGRLIAGIEDGAIVVVDGLAFGAMPRIAHLQAPRLRLVALVHHPLALETGIDAALRERLAASERAALSHAHHVIVTSPATARTLVADYAVSPERLTIARPGTDRPEGGPAGVDRPGSDAPSSAQAVGLTPRPLPASDERSPRVLAVGSLTARKDHRSLVEALSRVGDLDWTCRIVGDDAADPAVAAALRRQVEGSGLGGRVTITGPVDDVEADYAEADIFALASRYEGYGMVFGEAMAHGLPILACKAGAIPDLVPPSAGILVEPGDVEALAHGLRTLLDGRAARQKLAAGARAAGRALPTWRQSAAIFAAALGAFADETLRLVSAGS